MRGMKVHIYYTGKTSAAYLREGERVYQQRLSNYLPITFETIPEVKGGGKLPTQELLKREGSNLLAKIAADDRLILLDEGGLEYRSVELATWMEKQLQRPMRRLVFAIGGAYGFDEAVYARADGKLSLSKLTFSHQMIRLFLAEQLYRAMTILRNEKYHNE